MEEEAGPTQKHLAASAITQQAAAGPAAEQDLFHLLQQAMGVAAAAAAGLTPELAAAFAALPPMDPRQVGRWSLS